MTEAERAQLESYVRRLADMMSLKDWRFEVSGEPSDWANCAEITITYGQFHASIKFQWNFLQKTVEERRYTVTHELLHCHFDTADRIAKEGSSPAQREAIRLTMEQAVDNVARALAPFLPLPEEPEAKREP